LRNDSGFSNAKKENKHRTGSAIGMKYKRVVAPKERALVFPGLISVFQGSFCLD